MKPTVSTIEFVDAPYRYRLTVHHVAGLSSLKQEFWWTTEIKTKNGWRAARERELPDDSLAETHAEQVFVIPQPVCVTTVSR